MPIFEQNYRPWDGNLKSGGFRWMPILSSGIRQSFKRRWFLVFYLLCWTTFIVFAAIMIWAAVKTPILPIEGFLAIGSEFFKMFLTIQNIVIWIITIWIGSNLINQDFQSNALQLYLSKPLTSNDYIFGKFSIIAFFILSLSAVPALLLFLIRALIFSDPKWVINNFWLIFSILGYNCVIALTFSFLILFFSSITKNSRFSGIGFIVVYFMLSMFGQILAGITRSATLGYLSLQHNILNALDLFFGHHVIMIIEKDTKRTQIMESLGNFMDPFTSVLILIGVSIIMYLIIRKKVSKTEVIQ